MNGITLLVDLDDTVENLSVPWIEYLNNIYGYHVDPKEDRDWDLTKTFPNLTEYEIFQPLMYPDIWERVTPLPGAVKYLRQLLSEGYDIYFVSASHPDTVTMKYVNMIRRIFPFIPPEKLIITNRKQMIKGDILVDDYPGNLVEGEYHGILMTAPHNTNYEIKDKNIKRVNNWEEAYKEISRLSRTILEG